MKVDAAASVQKYMQMNKAQAQSKAGVQAQALKSRQAAPNQTDRVSISPQATEAKNPFPAAEAANQQQQNAQQAENALKQAIAAYNANKNSSRARSK